MIAKLSNTTHITKPVIRSTDRNRSLIGRTSPELEQLAVQLGEKPFRGRQLYDWIYCQRVLNIPAMSNLSRPFRQKLRDTVHVDFLDVIRDQIAPDGTRKVLFGVGDGDRVEAVYIPEGERRTICISSQVGCLVGCKFCATGKMGFKRNLDAGEIITQLFDMEALVGKQMTNVVMMGMGEPLLNRNELFRAISLFTDPQGVALSPRRVTVSTAGWLPGIEAMTRESMSVKLAVSFNGTTGEQRSRLMPLVAKYPIPAVLDAMKTYGRQSKQRVAISYLLLHGFNDAPGDARRLAKMAHRAGAKVNLMEYNPIDAAGSFSRTPPESAEQFLGILTDSGVTVTMRTSRGRGIAAACGQLAGEYETGSGKLIKDGLETRTT